MRAESDPVDAYRRIEHLCRGNEDATASRLALAEAALAADIWGEARRHLIALISRDRATASAYRLMARLERRESGDDQAAIAWMAKITAATPDPLWTCRACGAAQEEWQPACRHCSTFAALEWQDGTQKSDDGRRLGGLQEAGVGDVIPL